MELIEQIAVYTRDLVLLYELRPDDPALLLALANQHAAAGEEALAEQYLSRFNETIVDVDNIDVTQSLADYWTSRRRWPQAAQALRAIADQSPEMNIS